MSELYAVGKIDSANDKASNLYEKMVELGIIPKNEKEESIEITEWLKQIVFPRGYYRTLVYQMSCILSEDDINNIVKDKENFWINLKNKVVFNNRNLLNNCIEKKRNFYCLFNRLILSAKREYTYLEEFQQSFYELIAYKESTLIADIADINDIKNSECLPKIFLMNIANPKAGQIAKRLIDITNAVCPKKDTRIIGY